MSAPCICAMSLLLWFVVVTLDSRLLEALEKTTSRDIFKLPQYLVKMTGINRLQLRSF